MGMYTELIFGASLKNLPENVIEALEYSINNKENVSQEALNFVAKYELLRIFKDSSDSFGAHRNTPTFVYDEIGKHWVLSTRTSCKNYSNEIEQFLEYIEPYIEFGSGPNNIYAYVQYEVDDFPTIYCKKGVFDWINKEYLV